MEIPELLGMSEITSEPFLAIRTVGALQTVERQRLFAIHHGQGYKLQEVMKRREQLVKDWAQHRGRLPLADLKEIVARYPWVRDL